PDEIAEEFAGTAKELHAEALVTRNDVAGATRTKATGASADRGSGSRAHEHAMAVSQARAAGGGRANGVEFQEGRTAGVLNCDARQIPRNNVASPESADQNIRCALVDEDASPAEEETGAIAQRLRAGDVGADEVAEHTVQVGVHAGNLHA